jgi:hypothetical protein
MQRRTLICALGALTLLVAGCSSDDDSSSDTTEAEPTGSLIEPASTAAGGSDAPAETAAESADSADSADSGDSGDAGGMVNGTPDPCALLPTEAVAAVFGDPTPQPETSLEPAPPLNLRQCQWLVEPDLGSLRAIYLSVQTTEGFRQGGVGGGAYEASDQYEGTRNAMANAVDVTGLGDAAFFTDDTMDELQVLIGDTLLGISSQTVGSKADPITGDQLRALMEAALASL